MVGAGVGAGVGNGVGAGPGGGLGVGFGVGVGFGAGAGGGFGFGFGFGAGVGVGAGGTGVGVGVGVGTGGGTLEPAEVLTLAVAAEGFAIGIGRPLASRASTEAVFVIPAVRLSVMTTLTLPAPAIGPRLQETVVPAAVHVPCPGAAEITVAPVTENVSVITTCGTAVLPVLLTVME